MEINSNLTESGWNKIVLAPVNRFLRFCLILSGIAVLSLIVNPHDSNSLRIGVLIGVAIVLCLILISDRRTRKLMKAKFHENAPDGILACRLLFKETELEIFILTSEDKFTLSYSDLRQYTEKKNFAYFLTSGNQFIPMTLSASRTNNVFEFVKGKNPQLKGPGLLY